MPRPSPASVDPLFAEITKAIYGDVDAREIAAVAKSMPGPSDVHIDGPMSDKQAKRQKRIAYTGLGATGVAGAAGLDAIRTSVKENKHRQAAARAGGDIGPVGTKLGRLAHLKPRTAAGIVGGGLLALHGVELAADTLGAHAQLKALKQANATGPDKRKPVAKAFRLRPLNALPDRIPSLRAKRPKLTPSPANPVTQAGLYQPVRKGLRSAVRAGRATLRTVKSTTTHAEGAAKQAEQATAKINALIPSRRTAMLAAGGGAAALVGGTAAGSYAGSYAGSRHGSRKNKRLTPVAKAESLDLTWTGTIAKVDAEKRQVFGWASVSAIGGEEIVDLQGDIVPIDEVEKSAYRYVIESRKGGDMHKRVAKADEPLHTADMIESFVVTPEKLSKMGLPADALPHGWWVGFKVNDDAQWAMVKSGERQGFSIHGAGRRTAVAKAETDRTTQGLAAGSAASGGAAVGLGVAAHRKYRLADKQAHTASRRLGYAAQTIAGGANVTDHRLPGPPNVIPNKKAMRTLDRMIGEGNSEHRQAFKTLKRAGRLGHGATAAAVGSVALGSAAVARHRRLSKASRLDDVKDKAGDARDKAAKQLRRTTSDLKRRADQAINPPPVKTHRVKSSAVRSMGYQPQTRRLAVEMRSRPGQPYEYKMKTGAAMDALTAPSKGYHYATQIRGKADRADGYSPADRARLFLNPVSKAGPKELGSRPPQTGHRDEGFGAGARPADGRRITSKPSRYSLGGNAKEFGRGASGGFQAGSTRWARNDKNAKATRKFVLNRVIQGHTAGSEHPGAFKAGIKAGRGAVHAAKYGPAALIGTTVVAAGKKTVDDRREANRRIAARQQSVGKGLGSRAGYAAATAIPLAAVGFGGYVAGTELNRKTYNKHGAQLKPFEAVRHPIRAQNKAFVGANRKAATIQLNRAEKTTNPRKAELHRVRAERFNTEANRYARKAGIGKGMVNGGPPRSGLPGDNRDAQQARARRTVGLSTAGVGYLLASRSGDVAPGAADLVTRSAKKIGKKPRKVLIASRTKTIRRLSGKGGAGLVGAGLLLAGEGTVSDLRNRGSVGRTGKQVREKLHKSAFGVPLDQDNNVGKAFNSERSRHSRQDMYAGGATGGAVVAGAGAAAAGRTAREARRAARAEAAGATKSSTAVRDRLAGMSQPVKTGGQPRTAQYVAETARLHRDATERGKSALKYAAKGRKLTRVSGALGLGAAALGGTAYSLHDYDRRRGGRSYGY